MNSKKIFITGASGCIGHYLVETLIQQTNHELYLLVRNSNKLKIDCKVRPGIHILESDLREIDRWAEILKTTNVAILAATAWGGTQEVFDINVVKTIKLLKLLNPEVCEQVVYFSTASVLDRHNQLLKEANQFGTDYIRSKYEVLYQMSRLKGLPPITAVFPTLVLGGDGIKPYSHLSSGLPDIVKHINKMRWLRADGSFHFIHAEDIARVVRYLTDNPPEANRQLRKLVLGNSAVTVDRAIKEVCKYLNKFNLFGFPLSPWLVEVLIFLFQVKMAPWDRFCLDYRHFTYEEPVNPATFGLPSYCSTMADVLRTRGISRKGKVSKPPLIEISAFESSH